MSSSPDHPPKPSEPAVPPGAPNAPDAKSASEQAAFVDEQATRSPDSSATVKTSADDSSEMTSASASTVNSPNPPQLIRPASPPKPPQPAEAPSVPAASAVGTGGESAPEVESESSVDLSISRQQPIPPPSEPMQYRAIGLIRGRYIASDEQFTRGTLIATDGTEINAVLLGRIMSLVKKHLDLEQEHLWVVYPRTREKEADLHAQIVGVWEPENLNKDLSDESEADASQAVASAADSGFEDNYFSIRGEVVYYSPEEESVVVKIRQSPRKEADAEKAFKLQLKGILPGRVLGYFWDLDVQRQDVALVITGSQSIGVMPPKKKPQRGGRRDQGPRKYRGDAPPRGGRPSTNVNASSQPMRKAPPPKPIKRKEKPEGE